MWAPGNRFRCLLHPSTPVDLVPSLLGISISSPLSSRHDGTKPISFRIKHRFIILRPSATIEKKIVRKLLRHPRRENVDATTCLFIRKEEKKERKEKEGRQILLKSPLPRNCLHYFHHQRRWCHVRQRPRACTMTRSGQSFPTLASSLDRKLVCNMCAKRRAIPLRVDVGVMVFSVTSESDL